MQDKVVLITNSTFGIGKKTAIHFASLGAKLVIIGRQENDVSEVVQQCEQVSSNAYKPLGVVTNLSDDNEIKMLVQLTIDTFQQLDVLVNNADFEAPDSDDDPDLMDMYRSVTDTNVIIPLLLTQLCIPLLKKTKGCIINVGPIGIDIPSEKLFFYEMEKAALDMMTKCYASELEPKGIRLNGVNPEYKMENFYLGPSVDSGDIQLFVDMKNSKCPLGKIDVAKVITLLASDAASSITGVIIQTDGANLYINP